MERGNRREGRGERAEEIGQEGNTIQLRQGPEFLNDPPQLPGLSRASVVQAAASWIQRGVGAGKHRNPSERRWGKKVERGGGAS